MEEGKGHEGPPLFSHKPRVSQAAAASDTTLGASSTSTGGAATGSRMGVDLQKSFNEKLRGGFGLLLALNLFLGGYMLFQGKRTLRRVEDEVEEEEERNRHHKAHPTHKGPHKEGHREGSKEGGQREGVSRERGAGGPNHREMQGWRQDQGPEGQAVEESHLAEKLLWARDDLDEYLDRCLSFDAGTPPRRPAKAISYNEQMAVLQWILEEKRREHPATRVERRRIDADKRLLKDFMRSGKRLPLQDL